NVTPCIRKQTRFQFLDVAGGIHGHHPRTVGGPTVHHVVLVCTCDPPSRTQPKIWLNVDPRSVGQVTDRGLIPKNPREKNSSKGRPTARPMNRRSDHRPWSASMHQTPKNQPSITNDD
ncbi:hypothetical protein MTR67_002488, partial [Solanum verrucosum]